MIIMYGISVYLWTVYCCNMDTPYTRYVYLLLVIPILPITLGKVRKVTGHQDL